MHLEHLWLTDFRNYAGAELHPAPDGLTVVVGANGQGKTNLLEAVGYLATLRSFRGAPGEALVRVGRAQAVVRAQVGRSGREVLIEAELHPSGRDRVQVNRQPLRRTRDLLGAFQVTVFAPDDLSVVKGGPDGRRSYLDDLLVALHPRHDATRGEVERVLRQRNALLRSAAAQGGRPPADVLVTLDVWDAKLSAAGESLVAARAGAHRGAGARHRRLLPGAGCRVGAAVGPGGGAGVPPELGRAAGGGAGRRPPARPPSGRDDRRAASRRAGAHRRWPAGPHPRVAGRAAHPRPGAAPGRPSRGHRPPGYTAGVAARRCVLRAGRRPGRGAAVPLASRTGAADHRWRVAPRRGAGGRGARRWWQGGGGEHMATVVGAPVGA